MTEKGKVGHDRALRLFHENLHLVERWLHSQRPRRLHDELRGPCLDGLWRCCKAHTPECGPLKSYAFTAMRNALIDFGSVGGLVRLPRKAGRCDKDLGRFYRWQDVYSQKLADGHQDAVHENAQRQELRQWVRDQVAALPADLRRVMEYAVHGHGPAETARGTGLSLGTTNYKILLAKDLLRERLGPELEARAA